MHLRGKYKYEYNYDYTRPETAFVAQEFVKFIIERYVTR